MLVEHGLERATRHFRHHCELVIGLVLVPASRKNQALYGVKLGLGKLVKVSTGHAQLLSAYITAVKEKKEQLMAKYRRQKREE
jgi:hypothetical protein